MLTPQFSSYDTLDPLGDRHLLHHNEYNLDGSYIDPQPLSKPMMKTFTRLTKLQSNCSINLNDSLSITLTPPAEADTNSSLYNNFNQNKSQSLTGSNNNNGLQRFKPSIPNKNNNEFDCLQKKNLTYDPYQSFNTLPHYDRMDIKDLTLLGYTEDSGLTEKHVLSCSNDKQSLCKPCPTFTRITKPRQYSNINNDCNNGTATTTTASSLVNNGSKNSINNNSSLLLLGDTGKWDDSHTDQLGYESSPLLMQNNKKLSTFSAAAATKVVAPTPALAPAPSVVSSYAPLPRLPVPTLLLSLALSPPSSAVPSLCSASSSCSSSLSSSSSSPPSSCFLFPIAERNDWWSGLSLAESPCTDEEGQIANSSNTDSSLLGTIPTPTPLLSKTFYRNRRVEPLKFENMALEDCIEDPLESPSFCSLQLDTPQCSTALLSSSSSSSSSSLLPSPSSPSCSTTRTRGGEPSPSIQTGFCSLSTMNIAPVGEPVPQDFLGEADLPYPSPTTQQERQARQRKRAEQLRQLKLHEEREAKENWSRLRRRGASFSVGMNNQNSLSSIAETIQPSSSSSSSSMSWTVRKPLQRSPSSPSKVGDHSSSSSSSSLKKNGSTKLRVRFDMKANEIIEFEVEEEYDSRSKPSSPGFAPPNFRLSSGRTAYEIGGN